MKSYGLGWRLVFAAGFFPTIAGCAMLTLAWWSATFGVNDSWTSLLGRHSFSAASLQHTSPELYALWLLTVHLCGVNLAMSGVTMSAVAWFALRDGRSWAWPFLWALALWIGLNDAAALVFYRVTVGAGIPYALIPLTLASVGLIQYRSEQMRLTSPAIAEMPRFCDERFREGGDWVTFPEHNGFNQRYLRSPLVVCETLMSARGEPATAIELLRGPWDWWDEGRAFGFEVLAGGAIDQVLVPVWWYWAHVRMRVLPPVELHDLAGWRIPLNFTGSFNGSASLDVYPDSEKAQLVIRGRFHAVIENVPGLPPDFVTASHLRAESGTLPFPFPKGTGWLGLRRRLAERLEAHA